MLTRLTVRNFKRFEEVVIDLDSPVLFIGPNNSGKTTALQALAEFAGKAMVKRRIPALFSEFARFPGSGPDSVLSG